MKELTQDEMIQAIKEITLETPRSASKLLLDTPEKVEAYLRLKEQVEEIKRKGGIVESPE